MIRLQKYLADAGVASRRKAEEIILEGRVSVNGVKITELGTKIDPEKDKVTVDTKSINANVEKVYYLLNKPSGYTTTTSDPHAKHTVLELLPSNIRIFPVGRLDKDTTGLLILTNDGEFANKLTHPRYEKEKEYILALSTQLSAARIKELEEGVIIDGKKTAPARIRKLSHPRGVSTLTPQGCYSIIIREGRNRQVRKMFDKVGSKVVKLKRVRISNLSLGNLKEGEFRELSKLEVKSLVK